MLDPPLAVAPYMLNVVVFQLGEAAGPGCPHELLPHPLHWEKGAGEAGAGVSRPYPPAGPWSAQAKGQLEREQRRRRRPREVSGNQQVGLVSQRHSGSLRPSRGLSIRCTYL